MRRSHRLILAALSIFLGAVTLAQDPPPLRLRPAACRYAGTRPDRQHPRGHAGDRRSIADEIFESVSVGDHGGRHDGDFPRTDAEWMTVRNNALILAESGNLLKMPRPVGPAKPIKGVSFEMPGPDDLSPAQVEILLKQNRAPFNAFAQKLDGCGAGGAARRDARNGPVRPAIDQAARTAT